MLFDAEQIFPPLLSLSSKDRTTFKSVFCARDQRPVISSQGALCSFLPDVFAFMIKKSKLEGWGLATLKHERLGYVLFRNFIFEVWKKTLILLLRIPQALSKDSISSFSACIPKIARPQAIPTTFAVHGHQPVWIYSCLWSKWKCTLRHIWLPPANALCQGNQCKRASCSPLHKGGGSPIYLEPAVSKIKAGANWAKTYGRHLAPRLVRKYGHTESLGSAVNSWLCLRDLHVCSKLIMYPHTQSEVWAPPHHPRPRTHRYRQRIWSSTMSLRLSASVTLTYMPI